MRKDVKDFLTLIRLAMILIAMLWVVFAFVIGIKMVPNDDMSPRLDAGDIMLYYRMDKMPNFQDVVVVSKNKTEYVGRVVAKGGDKVEITKEENLIINGNMVTESMIFEPTPMYEGYQKYPVTLKEDEYFILADKRNGGEDSRYFGPVKKKEIKGTIIGQYRRVGF